MTTKELLKAQSEGRTIVCAYYPYKGWAMTYDPRSNNDPSPWRVTDLLDDKFRYLATECEAR